MQMSQTKKADIETAWSGRFSEGMDARLRSYNASIPFDWRLAPFDIQASIAHANMLASRDIISVQDFESIQSGLMQIGREIEHGKFQWSLELEDVHFNIEQRLTERIGDAGKRLHTARSRNDQVATTLRLYVRHAFDRLLASIGKLQRAFVDQADTYADVVMPGFTHLQVAQPVTFGHHLMAYYEMLERDRARFTACRQRLNVLPLGSGALAGTGFPIDRDRVAKELGFDGVTRNSMDAVSDRDFIIDYLAAASTLMVHLSRLSEELILWSTTALSFVDIPDRFCTGSSIMPQKKNPDVPELARGKTGRVVGHLMALLMIMKGQPLAYNKDNQETQEALFDADETLTNSVDVFVGIISGLKPRIDNMRAAAESGHSTATDLADHFVKLKVPFRDAHEIVAIAVRAAEISSVSLSSLGVERIQQAVVDVLGRDSRLATQLDPSDLAHILSVNGSVESRSHVGGTSPEAVRREVARARADFDKLTKSRISS